MALDFREHTSRSVVSDLATGTRFSHYEIVSRLGAGGMGEVYKAYDRTLERHVALKILIDPTSSSEEALRRFAREAKAASSLNHPGIITVHEIGRASIDGLGENINYIAMELVDGETLRSFISGKFDLVKALQYLAQTADALAKAHAAGLVHRDLKPENIMVTVDGYAKILDFGLVKSNMSARIDTDASTSVHADEITRDGIVMGTTGYMSPEQVRGMPVDHRSDIFSFGCILYEVATHRQPFRGPSAVDTFHKIVYEPPPPIGDLDPPVTPDLERVIRKALAKDPEDRYQSVKEIAIDLREVRKDYESGRHLSGAVSGAPVVRREQRVRSGRWIPWLVASVAIGAIALLSWAILRHRTAADRTTFEAMKIERLVDTSNAEQAAISPDGRYVAHVDATSKGSAIFVRQMASGSEIAAAPADGEPYTQLHFSRDGEYVRFTHRGSLQQAPVLGGTLKILIEKMSGPVSLSPDGMRCAFVRDGSLFVARSDGSGERRIAAATSRDYYSEPAWSPRGDVVACTRRRLMDRLTMWIEVFRPDAGDSIAQAAAPPVILGGKNWFLIASLNWLPDGSAIIVNGTERVAAERQLWEISYPEGRLRRITNDLFSYSGPSISADGLQLVAVQIDKRSTIWIAPLSAPERAKRILDGLGPVNAVSWLPDGGFLYSAAVGGNTNIWLSRADGSSRMRLTDDPHNDSSPVVSPDGRMIAFVSDRSGQISIWTMNRDGSRQTQITHGGWDGGPQFSADGKSIIYSSRGSGKFVIWKIAAGGGAAVSISSQLSVNPSLSPDGRTIVARGKNKDQEWKIALISADNGKPIRSFEERSDSGFVWAKDSQSFCYSRDEVLYRQNVNGSPPEKLADFKPDELSSFDLTADGASLIYARTSYQRGVVVLRNFR